MIRFAIYMTAATVHLTASRITLHFSDPDSLLSLIASVGLLVAGCGFLALALFDSKEGRDG